MKKYDHYKDSGIEWIGEIPEHWCVARYRYYYISNMGTTLLKQQVKEQGKFPVYSATEEDVIFGYVASPSFILDNGDFVIPARGNSIGHVKLISEPATSTQTTIYSKKNKDISSGFVYYFLKGLRKHLFQFDRTAIPQITVNQVKNNPLLIPSKKEQTTIAEYLDKKTSEIGELIADKEELLKLYEEEKTAVINHAVTKGIDPNVKMKDSGIECLPAEASAQAGLGEIPEHWEVKKLKWVYQTTSGGTPKTSNSSYYHGDIPWLRTLDLNNGELYESEINITDEGLNNSSAKLVPVDSILVAMYGGAGTIGKSAILKFKASINQAICAILPNEAHSPEFLHYFVRFYRPYWMVGAEGTRRDPNISQAEIQNKEFVFPPFKEQQAIVIYIASTISEIDTKIENTQKLIELLKEYREVLISEVVTGKVKVV